MSRKNKTSLRKSREEGARRMERERERRRPDLDLRSPHWRSVNGDSDMRVAPKPAPVSPKVTP